VVTAHALAPEVAANKRIRQEKLHNHRLRGRPTSAPGAFRNSRRRSSNYENEAFGINTALKRSNPRSVSWIAVKPNKINKKANMLNKLNKRRGGFTLVEIMIVVAIIALLAAIAVPGFLRARKRSQASRIINDLRLIDSAVDQYAIENNKSSGFLVPITEWTKYLKAGTNLYVTGKDILGNPYAGVSVDVLPSVPSASKQALSDVVDATFWSPYN
jgi:prepilin-type N-terminal cleavage/methylation domain-containing protein